ncbi:TBC1 domain family member 30-like [Ylistrum balloti]|uniref:TBC1 domain family member 30-like n=1 Tax=Ylistrum balloti TaxID=509963 RepID=UPI0029059C36|nr:TBC1 domain family member 30-like [Ylistrum balloti]
MATHSSVLSLPSPGPRGDHSGGKGILKFQHSTWRLEHQSSLVDDLLFEIYDRWHDGRHDSFESDTFTECSSASDVFHWRRSSIQLETTNSGRIHQATLEAQSVPQLRQLVQELQHRVSVINSQLVRQLKRRERRQAKVQHNADIVTAILQAASQKRRIDTRLRFSLEPPLGDSAFDQWKDAMQAVSRLPLGIPDGFRRKVWISLAENHIKELRIDWEKTVRFVFNERSNPDDNTLGLQIVKDLHRTGCSGFSGQDNDEDRAVLKRVLLAYARWNKSVGYCQGFNVIAALLLEVMERKEDDALMVMIYLIDHVLPDSYFANNLRALSVDMAVFRDLLGLMFPKLSKHLDYLQYAAQDKTTGANYEPPLTNVFTMQWFLTMFATCLPKAVVLRVWDSILLEGSEILLRTALAIWGKLSRRILSVGSADEFYSLMGLLTQDMMDGKIFDADALIKFIYSCAPFPMQQLPELREKYTYNIRPFSSTGGAKKGNVVGGMVLPSDEDDLDEDDLEAITCFTGILPGQIGQGKSKGLEGDMSGSSADISSVGPGAYGAGLDSSALSNSNLYLERMSTDISSLKKQYQRLRQRQTQAHIILAAASAKQQAKTKFITPKIESPKAINHLFVGKGKGVVGGKNKMVAESPRIANAYPKATIVHHFLQEVKKQKSPSRRSSRPSEKSKERERTEIEKASCVQQTDSNSSNVLLAPSGRLTDKSGSEGDITRIKEFKRYESKHLSDQELSRKMSLNSDSKLSTQDDSQLDVCISPEESEEVFGETTSHSNENEWSEKQEYYQGNMSPHSCISVSTMSNISDISSISSPEEGSPKMFPLIWKNVESLSLEHLKQEDLFFEKEDHEDVVDKKMVDKADMEEHKTVQDKTSNMSATAADNPSVGDENVNELSSHGGQIESVKYGNQETPPTDPTLASNCDIPVSSEQVNHEKDVVKDLTEKWFTSDKYASQNGGTRLSKLDIERANSSSYDSNSSSVIISRDRESRRQTSDSDSSSLFSPTDSASDRCFSYSYSEKSGSERSLSQSSQESVLSTQVISEHLGNYSKSKSAMMSKSTKQQPFSPFPVKHFNENRAKTGIKLGMYKAGTIQQLGKQSKQRALWTK